MQIEQVTGGTGESVLQQGARCDEQASHVSHLPGRAAEGRAARASPRRAGKLERRKRPWLTTLIKRLKLKTHETLIRLGALDALQKELYMT